MKKFIPLIILSALFLVPTTALAGTLTDPCFPIVYCPAGQDAYAGACNPELNSVSGTTPSCVSVNGAAPVGQYWAFSCDAGCYLKGGGGGGSVDPCPGGIMVGGKCLIKLNVVDDNVPVTGEKAYKIWDGTTLTEVVHLNTAGCPDGQISVSSTTSATGWTCTDATWVTGGGKLAVGAAVPGAALDVEMSTGGAATIGASTNVASGNYAVALGANAAATGVYSLAAGLNVTASNWGAIAMGSDAQATGIGAIALGDHTRAGGYSFAAGVGSEATNNAAIAMGGTVVASGGRAVALGGDLTASGDYSFAANRWTLANSYSETVIGQYNVTVGIPAYSATSWVATDPLFVVGRGSSDVARANALTVLKNGNVGINTATPTSELVVADGPDLDTYGTVNADQYCLGGGACLTGWPAQNFGWYVGSTSTAVNGLQGGYTSANNQCITAYAGSHICTADEMISSYNNTPSGPIASLASSVWVNSGPPSYIVNVTNDCQGWNSNGTTIFGYVWDGVKDASYVTPCNMTRKIACCK